MGLVGFDPELVATSIKNVQSAYDDLIRAIATDMQSQFVNGMQDKWACADAQKFFQSFKNVMDILIKDSNNTFQSVVEAMNSAANGWAQQTGGTWANKAFNRLDKEIDVSSIQENIGGVRGADPEATSVSGRLASISSSAISALSAAQSAVQNCGFIGGSSASSLISSLGKIKANIESAVNQISNDCQKAIETTSQTYTNLDVKISDGFSGGSSSSGAGAPTNTDIRANYIQ